MTTNSTTAEDRLAKLGIHLPDAPTPFGAYVPAVQTGNLLFLSGMLATSGHTATVVGVVGKDLDVKAGREAAYTAALNVLALTKKQLGSLNRVSQLDNMSADDLCKAVRLLAGRAKLEASGNVTLGNVRAIAETGVDYIAHPECSPEVVAASDYSGSTNAMIRYVEKTRAPRYLLLTECSMGDNISAANPEKEMLRLCNVRCPHMNQITLEDTLASLINVQYEIEIDEEIRRRALHSVERMLAIG